MALSDEQEVKIESKKIAAKSLLIVEKQFLCTVKESGRSQRQELQDTPCQQKYSRN